MGVAESNADLAGRIVRDLDALIDHLDPDVVWDNTDHSPPDHGGVFCGKQAVERIFREWVSSWARYRIDVQEIVDAGDDVVLVVTESGLGSAGGVPIEHHHCYVWSFRDGRIVAGRAYGTREEALAAVGRTP